MWRAAVTAVLGLLLSTGPAVAQLHAPPTPPRVSVAPFVGARVPFSTDRSYRFVASDEQLEFSFAEEHGGGPAVGGELEVRVGGPLSVLGAFVYSRAGDVLLTDLGSQEQELYLQLYQPTLWFARAGIAARLPEPQIDNRRFRSTAFVWARPALVRETFSAGAGIPGYFIEPVNNWAINVGAKAVAPFGVSRFAFHLALEDYVTFWNRDEWQPRWDRLMRETAGVPVRSQLDYPVSNILMLRTGLTVSF